MKFESKKSFTAEQKVWLIQVVLRDGMSKAEAWRQLTGEHTGRPADVPASDIAYKPFRKRMAKLVGTNIDKIQPAGGGENEPDNFNPSPIDISNLDGQMAWLRAFISDHTSGAKPGDRLRALTTLQEWEKQTKPEGDEPGFITIGGARKADANYTEVTENTVVQMLMLSAMEIGFHNLPLISLNQEDLKLLIQEVVRVYWQKKGGIAGTTKTLVECVVEMLEADGIKPTLETSGEKLARLRDDIENLSEEEVRAMEAGQDQEIQFGSIEDDES